MCLAAQTRNQERPNFRINNGDPTLLASSGSASEIGEAGGSTSLNRSLTHISLLGDINVNVTNGDLVMKSSNHTYGNAFIGHGGNELGDYETAGIMAGDITITVAGDLTMQAGGQAAVVDGFLLGHAATGDNNDNFRSHVIIGHGGYRTGFQGAFGDITVNTGGDVHMTGGSYEHGSAKIGHGGRDAWGQVGGEFSRAEQYSYDGVNTDLTWTVIGNDYRIQQTITPIVGAPVVTDRTFTLSGNTTNIVVNAVGNITMDHLEAGEQRPYNVRVFDTNIGSGLAIANAFVQIGHGGSNNDLLRTPPAAGLVNTSYALSHKTGNIDVTGFDITMLNGGGFNYWTRIGHGGSDGLDRATVNRGSYAANLPYYMVFTGDINVTALNNLVMDASAGAIYDQNSGGSASGKVGNPNERSPVVIGHGGVWDNWGLVTLDDGTMVNGSVTASADINVTVGNNMTMLGGNQRRSAYVQVGHGYPSDSGNDSFTRDNADIGQAGDITVIVGNDLYMEAGQNAVILQPVGPPELYVQGAEVRIGHGGSQIDGSTDGDISVYVGNDLTMIASQRTGPLGADSGGNPIGSLFGLVQIGNGSAGADGFLSPVNGNHSGDIVVVVGNDLQMTGGFTADQFNEPVQGAYAQIGLGGVGVTGTKTGDITVLVGNNFTTTDGSDPVLGGTNYVKVGHGGWMRDGFTLIVNSSRGAGTRSGDIDILVGNSANLDHTMIGHADPAVRPWHHHDWIW